MDKFIRYALVIGMIAFMFYIVILCAGCSKNKSKPSYQLPEEVGAWGSGSAPRFLEGAM